jgi:hypothetical protein
MVIVMPLGRSTSQTSVSHPGVAPASMTTQVNVVDAAHGATRTQSRVRTGPVVLGSDAITRRDTPVKNADMATWVPSMNNTALPAVQSMRCSCLAPLPVPGTAVVRLLTTPSLTRAERAPATSVTKDAVIAVLPETMGPQPWVWPTPNVAAEAKPRPLA